MRGSTGVGLTLSLLLTGVALPSAGCGTFWGCDADATCRPDDIAQSGTTGTGTGGAGGDMACPPDPFDGTVLESCGIWVSSSLGDDKNPGSQDRPVRTLAQGIALASVDLQKGGRGYLYACAETYTEVVTLAAGVSLFGGFDCTKGWSYDGDEGKRAVIQAPPAVAALTLPASDRESAIVDVNVRTSDAEVAGGSSIGVLAQKGSRAVFRRAHVWAGNGADGANGADGGHGDASAKEGLPGQNGMDACTADAGLGGIAVVTHCGDGTQPTGGEGGDGNEVGASDGLTGLPEPNPNLQGEGVGGQGQDPVAGTVCTGGIVGAHGRSGADGFGAAGDGTLSNAGYEGIAGDNGENGAPGQGGGGGGASSALARRPARVARYARPISGYERLAPGLLG